MVEQLLRVMPAEVFKILLALLLSFLIGLEREERRSGEAGYLFGGVRTFPLIGLIGLALAQLDATSVWPVTIGLGVVGAFLWLSYQHKLQKSEA
ncbi:MAG TPA: MgtC/SapB family protein, partial [Candidatus Acidoferrales bacterium]|nr:MgtC/SapB family protein [Candidatus Acidoferrales bacterium]